MHLSRVGPLQNPFNDDPKGFHGDEREYFGWCNTVVGPQFHSALEEWDEAVNDLAGQKTIAHCLWRLQVKTSEESRTRFPESDFETLFQRENHVQEVKRVCTRSVIKAAFRGNRFGSRARQFATTSRMISSLLSFPYESALPCLRCPEFLFQPGQYVFRGFSRWGDGRSSGYQLAPVRPPSTTVEHEVFREALSEPAAACHARGSESEFVSHEKKVCVASETLISPDICSNAVQTLSISLPKLGSIRCEKMVNTSIDRSNNQTAPSNV